MNAFRPELVLSPSRGMICWLMGLTFGIAVLTAWAESDTPATPSAETILGDLRPGHPRLLLPEKQARALKTRWATEPHLARWYPSIREEAVGLLKAPVSSYEIPDGLRLLGVSRKVLHRVYALALVYRMEGGEAFAQRTWDELAAAAAFPDWNPRHFLDTAEMTHAFAIGYDWLYEDWTEEQRKLLREAMVEKGLKPALAGYRGETPHGWWAKARHNWNQVCNGGIGLGALALAGLPNIR